MYTKNTFIIILKVKNIILSIAGVFEIMVSLNAITAPGSVLMLVISLIILLLAAISNKFIGDANFYSGYFEGDLDGIIEYTDLAKVTGENVNLVKFKLAIFKVFYMKNYSLKGRVVLKDKKCICECRNCGSVIEKSVYFTGKCPACQTSDVFAKVLLGNRFYSIEQDKTDAIKTPEFYQTQKLKSKKIISALLMLVGGSMLSIMILYMISQISNYNNEEYLREVLLSGESHSSYELIKTEILEAIWFAAVFSIGFWQVLYSGMKKFGMVKATVACSEYFAKRKTPFVKLESLPPVKKWANKRMGMNAVRGAIRRRYLQNCTFEIHKDKLMLVLAKKIVKDKCPSCGAPITGAVDEHYKCTYCNRTIMYTIRKK